MYGRLEKKGEHVRVGGVNKRGDGEHEYGEKR